MLPPPSLDTADADGLDTPARPGYCPGELLGRFTLLMAGHGRCVSAAMMLGDRDYALWQLACARATGDAALQRLAAELFAHLTMRRG